MFLCDNDVFKTIPHTKTLKRVNIISIETNGKDVKIQRVTLRMFIKIIIIIIIIITECLLHVYKYDLYRLRHMWTQSGVYVPRGKGEGWVHSVKNIYVSIYDW